MITTWSHVTLTEPWQVLGAGARELGGLSAAFIAAVVYPAPASHTITASSRVRTHKGSRRVRTYKWVAE